jgi:hypothetical protein
MVAGEIAGNISAEATTQTGNTFDEPMRGCGGFGCTMVPGTTRQSIRGASNSNVSRSVAVLLSLVRWFICRATLPSLVSPFARRLRLKTTRQRGVTGPQNAPVPSQTMTRIPPQSVTVRRTQRDYSSLARSPRGSTPGYVLRDETRPSIDDIVPRFGYPGAPDRTRMDASAVPRRPCISTATCQWPALGIARWMGDRFAKPPMKR